MEVLNIDSNWKYRKVSGEKRFFKKGKETKNFRVYTYANLFETFSLCGEIGKRKLESRKPGSLNWFIWIHNCEAKRWMRMKLCEGSRDWNNEIPLPSKNSKNFSNLMFKSVPSLKRNWLLNRFWFNNKLRITFWNSSRDF